MLALAFGLLSAPFVAASLVQPLPDWQQEIVKAPQVGWPQALLLAVVSAVVASVVGGSLAGGLVRTRPVAATLVAIGTAWPIGIAMLSITAFASGIGLRIGVMCIDTCTPEITSADPLSGLAAYGQSAFVGAVFVVPLVVFISLMVVAWWLSRHHHFLAAVILTIVGYGALHMFSIFLGGGIAFACLALGTLIWATVLRRTSEDAKLKQQPSTPAEPPLSRT